jgi:hypothetical protein
MYSIYYSITLTILEYDLFLLKYRSQQYNHPKNLKMVCKSPSSIYQGLEYYENQVDKHLSSL